MNELANTLRMYAGSNHYADKCADPMSEAADRLEELEKENAELESEIRTLTRQNGEWREDRDQLAAQNVALRNALEIIAGKRQCYDNTMSNLDVAREVLNLPNISYEVMKRRDADTDGSADRLEVMEREHANFFDRWHGERRRREKLVDDVERCYRMLLSEQNTKGALFKAENILREALADAKAATHEA